MTKSYLIIVIIFFFTVFSTFEPLNAQSKVPTKKEQRLLKKQAKKRTKIITKAEATPTLNQQVEQAVKATTQTLGQTVKIPNQTVEQTVKISTQKEEQILQSQQIPTRTNQVLLEEIVKQSKDVIITKPNGNLNWSQQYIEATGQSVIDNERFKNPAQAKLMATRGAVVVAQRNLLEIVKGVQIIGETTVQDMITTSDYVYSRVEGVVKGAQQVGEAKEKDGFVEVRLRMPIYGKESLANTIDQQSLDLAKRKNGFELSPQLSQKDNETGEGIDGSNPIVFHVANESAFDPSMFPVVLDEQGKVLFDFSKIYNLKEGAFPQYLQLGKDVLQAYGNQKGVDIINMIQTGKGQFKIPEKSSKRVFWNKVARVAQDVGTVLFKLIL
jgi:hypothetical protein